MAVSPTERGYRRGYDQSIARTGAAGGALMDQYQTGMMEDPRAAFERMVSGAHDQFQERFSEDVGDLRGQHAGMGRIRTGFGGGDEDRLFRESARDMNSMISDRALQAESMNQGRLQHMGGMGERMSGEAMAARGGQYYSERDARLAAEAERRRRKGGLLQAGMGLLGTLAGGPIGGAIGGAIANKWGPKPEPS